MWKLLSEDVWSVKFSSSSDIVWLLIVPVVLLLGLVFRFTTSPNSLKLPGDTKKATEDRNAQSNLPVLIVGAGPTGLTLAAVLSRYGIPIRIIEKKDQLSQHTKATNLMQRNREFMSALGLEDAIESISGNMSRLMVHAYGKPFGPRTMHLKETPFADVLLCGQHNFEAVVADRLLKAGIKVEFNTELALLSQDPSTVTATTVRQGVRETSKYSYVVGCDGYAGPTRSFTTLDFAPYRTGVAIRQLDCTLRWHRLSTSSQMWLFYFTNGFAAVVPLPGNIHRVLFIEPKESFPARSPTLSEMESKLRLVASDPKLTLTDPLWFSYTDLTMGLAPALIDGRILLAGDASNPVLPNGGQGMNTGIADSFNLGWKLAAVLRGRSPASLLDSYNTERHAVRAALQTAQFNSLKYTTLSTPWLMRAAFRVFAEPALNLGGEYAMARMFSELDINTRKSELTYDGSSGGGLRAGDRALDAAIVWEYESVRLYELIYRGAWTLLGFEGRAPHARGEVVAAAFGKLSRSDLPSFVVSTRGEKRNGMLGEVLYDLDEEVHRVYGIVKPTLLLVRPDGHIAVRIRPGQVETLARYLEYWLGSDASHAFTVDLGK